MKTISCLVIEDEPLAQRLLQNHLSHFKELQLVATCENVLQAFGIMHQQTIDLLFLDISLPAMNGIDFIRSLKNPPAVIFTTAYSEFAVASYELEAVDYLLKPITFERFSQAIEKFFRRSEAGKELPRTDHLFLKENGQLVKLYLNEIRYIEARKDYVLVHLDKRFLITHRTMKAMEALLPAEDFVRIHRSYIIPEAGARRISGSHIEIAGVKLPVGEKYKQALMQRFRP
jgi:DNA-binding LytR/AlgR family response regulator